MVKVSISLNVLPLNSRSSALQVPESERPFPARAVQLPCQLCAVFLADQVPCNAISPASVNKLQEPLAAFGLVVDISASHMPSIIGPFPTVAFHLPVSSAGELCASAWVHKGRLARQKRHNQRDLNITGIEAFRVCRIHGTLYNLAPRGRSLLASPLFDRENNNSVCIAKV